MAHWAAPPLDPEKVLERVHAALYETVGQAVDLIMHMEKAWAKPEMVKRIVRYIYKSASSPELSRMEWREATKALIDGTMHAYSAACADRKWFFDIDLAPAFAATAWELVRMKPVWGEIQHFVVEQFENRLDDILVTRAIWDSVRATYEDPKVQAKMEKALSKTYQPSLDECLLDSRPLDDLQRVEAFAKKWIDASMSRAWSSIEDSEVLVTERSANQLFGNLIAPFGDQHPFSCIPTRLTERIGRPPRTWPFVSQTIAGLFRDWAAQSEAPTKRRKTDGAAQFCGETSSTVDSVKLDTVEIEDDDRPHAIVDLDAPTSDVEGHPTCTSADDCIGSDRDRLVRHIVNGDDGSMYCESCWRFFLDKNAALEGNLVTTGERFVR